MLCREGKTYEERKKNLYGAHFNVWNLTPTQLSFDMCSLGTSAMSQEQLAGQLVGDEAYAGARNFENLCAAVTRVLGHTYVCPTHNALGSHPEICGDTTYTLFNHITTPFFLRMDIGDPLADDRYVDWTLLPSGEAYHLALHDQLVALSASAGGLEPFVVPPRVYAPYCRQHVAVLTNDGFFQHHVSPAGNTFHDLFESWLHPSGGASEVQQDFNPTPLYSPSFCP